MRAGTPDDDRINNERRIRRYMRTRGPVNSEALAADLMLSSAVLKAALENMRQQKKVVFGRLIADKQEELWCDRHNFTQLYRMAVSRRRSVQPPANRLSFNRFLLEWHRISKFEKSLYALIQRYRGTRFPLNFFEPEILRSRYDNADASAFTAGLAQFEELISNGEVIVHSGRTHETGKRYIEFRMRGEGNMLTENQTLMTAAEDLSAPARTVFAFLEEHGASYARDLRWATGLSSRTLSRGLQELADKGLVGCENYQTFILNFQSLIAPDEPASENRFPAGGGQHPKLLNRRYRTKKSNLRKMVRHSRRVKNARWFLTNSLVVMGRPLDIHKRAIYQARLLLQRYGILVKECYRKEQGLLPWYQIFQVLKRLEWQGEIRRGYFVAGLSGIQFALPEALELLQGANRPPSSPANKPVLLSTRDPALPFGGGIDWELTDYNGHPLKVIRSASNHLVLLDGTAIIYCERYFKRLSIISAIPQHSWESLTNIFKNYLKIAYPFKRVTRIDIHQINGQTAAASPFADQLLKFGFEKDADHLVLWPSAV